MRFLPILTLLLVLFGTTACSSMSKASMETLGEALFPKKAPEITREKLRSVPYTVLKMESAQYGTAYFVLGRIADNQRFWVAASHHVLVESHGLIRRTSGFPSTLAGTQFIGPDPFVTGLQHLRGGETFQRSVDWLPGYRFGVLLNSRFSPPTETTIVILQEPRTVRYVEEELRTTQGSFVALNRYWYSPLDGTVLRAEQQLTPEERLTVTYLPSDK